MQHTCHHPLLQLQIFDHTVLGLHLDDRLLHLLLAIKNLLCIFLTFLKDFLQLSFFFDLKLCDKAL